MDGRKWERKRGGGMKRLQKLLRGKKRGIRNGGDRSEENLDTHKVLKEARREVAKQRARENRDIIGVPCIQDENGNLKTEIGERLEV